MERLLLIHDGIPVGAISYNRYFTRQPWLIESVVANRFPSKRFEALMDAHAWCEFKTRRPLTFIREADTL